MPDTHHPHLFDDQAAAALRSRLGNTFATGRTHDLAWRKRQLLAVAQWLRDADDAIMTALAADLGKPALESYGTETGFCLAEIRHTLAHLEAWAAPERVSSPMVNLPSRSWMRHQPKGVALIIAPWNYPLQLAVAPMVAALSAGCCVVLKPSELAPATSALMAEALPRVLDAEAVAVVEGDVAVSTALLAQPWDHILFTGSTRVGRVVMEAAAKHLSPVTLELGGKSPVIVSRDADITLAAKRIAWGKGVNAGQTCIAPDYVLVERAVQDRFQHEIIATFKRFYGDDPQLSPDLARICTPAHHARLVGLLDGGTILHGGRHDVRDRFLEPTLLTDVDLDAPVMQEEIFGPILPIVPVDDLDEAIAFINARPHPLALYLFTRDDARVDRVLGRTLSGGACINDTLSHIAVSDLPFGGVGASGMGGYHGVHGFRTFSHTRGVVQRYGVADVPLRYPPYAGNLKWIRKVMR